MSKTAILLSGHMRNFDVCLPTMHWHVFRHYPDADFYVSTVSDEDSHKVELLSEYYDDRVQAVEVVPEQPDCVELLAKRMDAVPKDIEAFAKHAPYAISVPVQAILAQLWQLQRVYELMPSHQSYGTFIRIRPDLFFHGFTPTQPVTSAMALTPWWGRFGGINDRFAVLGRGGANAYFNTWDRSPLFDPLPHLLREGCPLHPESLIKATLDVSGINVSPTLRAEFSKVDGSGNLVRPWVQEVLPNDAANLR